MKLYFVPLIADITTEIFDRSKQSNVLSIRKSLDGLYTILAFDLGREPFEFLNKNYGPYTHAQILQYLIDNSSDWEESV